MTPAFSFLLRPSLIENAGVGCFSLSHVPAGDILDTGAACRARLTPRDGWDPFRKLTLSEIPDVFLKFCVLLPDGVTFLAPLSFHHMGIFWYVNHAREPNAAFMDRTMFAIRPIAPNDEITLYYSDLLTHPKNLLWVKEADI